MVNEITKGFALIKNQGYSHFHLSGRGPHGLKLNIGLNMIIDNMA